MREHNGLYQAIVVSSDDPKGKRRITARVPDVLGQTVSEWARPASIVDSKLKPGDMVWIHFPNGDLRYPVYHVPNDTKHGRIIPGESALSVNGPGAAGVTLSGDVHAKPDDGGYVRVLAADFVVVGGGGGSGFTVMNQNEMSLSQAISDMQQTINTLQNQVNALQGKVSDLEDEVEFLMSIIWG